MSELKTMQTTDILTVSADTLVDINDVVVNKELKKRTHFRIYKANQKPVLLQVRRFYCKSEVHK